MIIACIEDNGYLSWQAELLARNCAEHGHELTTLIGWRGCPSETAVRLQWDYNAVLVEDTRQDRSYAPSIQPHLLAKFVASDLYSGGAVLLVDSDILFKSLAFLDNMPSDTVLFSDCSSYLDARYVIGTDPDLLAHLCTIAGIAPEYVTNHPASGGAQYYLPHLFNADFWATIERNSTSMYRFMRNYSCRTHPVQKWTASMWAILYGIYKRELAGECRVAVSEALHFCFATDRPENWERCNILHMAGVTADMEQKGYFFKGSYTVKPPWECDLSHVQPDNCSFVYVEAIRRLSR